MSGPRQAKRRVARAKAKRGDIPYSVRRVFIQPEIEFLDGEKVRDVKVTEPIALHEAEFFPGLVEYLRSKGVDAVNLRPAVKDEKKTA